MTRFHLASLALIATSAAGLALAAPAAAAPSDMTPFGLTTVRYGDLRLDTDQGRRTLTRRVGNAVENVCGVGLSPLDPSVRACRQEARAHAVDDLGRAGITL